MEKLIKAVGDSLDRRSFFRMLGKLGMGAAAVAGVLLLPRRAYALECGVDPGLACNPDNSVGPSLGRDNGKNPCWTLHEGDPCGNGRKGANRHCHQNTPGDCTCTCE